MKVYWILCLFLLGYLYEPIQANKKLPVQVFVGSLCPDAIRFIQNQLYPMYPHIKDYVDIAFIPFGKAHSNRDQDGSVSFTCQHGPQDCSVSRIQLCAMIFLRQNPDAMMEFIRCQMASGSDRTGRTCTERVNLPFDNVINCYTHPLGEVLQLQAERMTNEIQYPLAWVPTITYNWEFDQQLSRRSEQNFREVICEQLNNSPQICRQ